MVSHLCNALTELKIFFNSFPGRCPGLICNALSELRKCPFFEMRPSGQIRSKCNANILTFYGLYAHAAKTIKKD